MIIAAKLWVFVIVDKSTFHIKMASSSSLILL